MAEQTVLRYPGASEFDRGAAQSGWGAVLALTLCVSTMIASEFMPVSIPTPIAFRPASGEPAAMVSGRYWHHLKPEAPAAQASNVAFQSELIDRLQQLTGVALP